MFVIVFFFFLLPIDVIGFSDSIIDIFKKGGGEPFTGAWANDQRVISVITMTVLAAMALGGGAKYYAKAQSFLLVALVIAQAYPVAGLHMLMFAMVVV